MRYFSLIIFCALLAIASAWITSCDNEVTQVHYPPEQVAPEVPELPTPRSDAEGQLISLRLSWFSKDLASDTLEYDLYFGDDTDPHLLYSNIPSSAKIVGQLDFETRYFWKVLARDKYDNETMASSWSFKTISDRAITFVDDRLESEVRNRAGKPNGELKISDVSGITEILLNNNGIRDLSGIEYLSNLREFGDRRRLLSDDAWGTRNVFSTLEPLKHLNNLVVLSFGYSVIPNLTYLALMDSLYLLDISGTSVSNLTPIENLPSLAVLFMDRMESVRFSSIVKLKSLESLSLRYCKLSSLQGFERIGDLTNLKYLYLDHNNLTDIEILRDAVTLERLTLYGNSVRELYPISALTELSHLDLHLNPIQDPELIEKFTKLEHLNISGTGIDDVRFLTNLTELQYLNLDSIDVYDLDVVENLTKLSSLSCRSSRISDLEPLNELTALSYLSLPDNSIHDITDLSGLTELKFVNLADNAISDILPLVNNPGIVGDRDFVVLSGNPLSAESVNNYIPQLQARGVHVIYE